MSPDNSAQFVQQIKQAQHDKSAIRICGGNSKAFYGNNVNGEELNTLKHTGIIEYHPSELVVTVRSGTRLSELEAELKAYKQMLAFEPPCHTSDTTIGGVIACNLSGPRRASTGAARDFVLGCNIINGKAEKLSFGGQVMKNVAGYDASRLMTGAQGCLGVLLDVSLKVLPIPEQEASLSMSCNMLDAIKLCRQWVAQGKSLSASCFVDNTLHVRFSNTHSAIKETITAIKTKHSSDGIQEIDNAFWLSLKNQQHDFFKQKNLWRLSVPANTQIELTDSHPQMFEWNGALRWLTSEDSLFSTAKAHSGHTTRYPIHESDENFEIKSDDFFQPLATPLMNIQNKLKKAFDPNNILNPGRLYREL